MSRIKNETEATGQEPAELLMNQLLHLKQYERPDESRMIRNRQNIMRQVREVNGQKRKSLGERLELNIPWFFAEPRYGIALLFVAFAGLQFLSVNSRNRADNLTSIYTSPGGYPLVDAAPAATNRFDYPSLPDNVSLFANDPMRNPDVKFVRRIRE